MNRILCSTGAFIGRPNGRDYTIMKSALSNLNCDGYEFMMYDTWYDKIDEIIDFILENKIKIFAMHFDKKIGEEISHDADGDFKDAIKRFEINCQIANKIGVKKAVLHLWGGLDSDRCFSHNIEAYKHFEKIANEYSIVLMIENIVCSNGSPFQRMVELYKLFPNINFIFDTKMAQFHGEMDLLYDENYAEIVKRIKHFHVNDYDGGYKEWQKFKTLHIGEGNVDFEKFFDFVKAIGYDGDFTVEGTSFDQTGKINFEKLNRDFEYINCKIF